MASAIGQRPESSAAGGLRMKVIWSPSALREIEQIFDHLADLNPGAASKVLESLVDAADRLVSFPNRGRLVRGRELREIVASYPYIIRYRVTPDAVRILRVRHTAQLPTDT